MCIELRVVMLPLCLGVFFDASEDEVRNGDIFLQIFFGCFEYFSHLFVFFQFFEVVGRVFLHLISDGIVDYCCLFAHFAHLSQQSIFFLFDGIVVLYSCPDEMQSGQTILQRIVLPALDFSLYQPISTLRILSASILSLNLLPFFLMYSTELSITLLWMNFMALRSFSREWPTSMVLSHTMLQRKGQSLFWMVLVTGSKIYFVIPLYSVLQLVISTSGLNNSSKRTSPSKFTTVALASSNPASESTIQQSTIKIQFLTSVVVYLSSSYRKFQQRGSYLVGQRWVFNSQGVSMKLAYFWYNFQSIFWGIDQMELLLAISCIFCSVQQHSKASHRSSLRILLPDLNMAVLLSLTRLERKGRVLFLSMVQKRLFSISISMQRMRQTNDCRLMLSHMGLGMVCVRMYLRQFCSDLWLQNRLTLLQSLMEMVSCDSFLRTTTHPPSSFSSFYFTLFLACRYCYQCAGGLGSISIMLINYSIVIAQEYIYWSDIIN